MQCKEHFIAWSNVPIKNFQQIMQDYNIVRNRMSPVFFCHEDGTNLTPNDMANWIELSTSQTDWRGLKMTSHCYRKGGTSYLYRSGLDIPNLQRSGRWSHTDSTSVEHYLKPGLYSASPDTIRDTLPQYKATMSISRAMFLRDIIMTKGGLDHPFNAVLKSLGFSKLQRTAYPTSRAHQVCKAKQTAAIAAKFLQKVKNKQSHLAKMNAVRVNTATRLKAEIKHWRLRNAPSNYGALTDIRRYKQCFSCHSIQWHAHSSEAKIQSLSHKITHQKELAAQLQEAKSHLRIMSSTNTTMKRKILQQEYHIKHQKSKIQSLKETIYQISKENIQLQCTTGHNSSQGRCHKQTQTARPGEDVVSEGLIMYPSPKVIDELKKLRETQFMQKYNDPNGEDRLIPIIKLHTNMYTAIWCCLSKRFRIC